MDVALQREIDDSRQAGRNLAFAIQAGVPIQIIDCPFRLRHAEKCVATGQVAVMRYFATDAEWVEKRGGGFGLLTMGLMGTAHMIGNANRKSEALRRATAQWRTVDQGRMWLTTERFAIQGAEWTNLWHEGVDMADCDGLAVELHLEGMPPTRLRISYADWWFVMMQWVGFGHLVMPPSG
jgi:hypothetical protein